MFGIQAIPGNIIQFSWASDLNMVLNGLRNSSAEPHSRKLKHLRVTWEHFFECKNYKSAIAGAPAHIVAH